MSRGPCLTGVVGRPSFPFPFPLSSRLECPLRRLGLPDRARRRREGPLAGPRRFARTGRHHGQAIREDRVRRRGRAVGWCGKGLRASSRGGSRLASSLVSSSCVRQCADASRLDGGRRRRRHSLSWHEVQPMAEVVSLQKTRRSSVARPFIPPARPASRAPTSTFIIHRWWLNTVFDVGRVLAASLRAPRARESSTHSPRSNYLFYTM